MKAKKYRLETVLGIRHRAKTEAARQLALRYEQLEEAEAELGRRRLSLQACYERQNQAQTAMTAGLDQGIQAQDVLTHQTYLNDLRKTEIELQNEVDQQIRVVAGAEKAVEAARDALIETARELKAIEVHKANWHSVQRSAENRREQKISDEIGAILHGRREI